MTTAPDLNKLTVPQLKALCKERGISGYSKLTKAALLQKLADVPTNASQGVDDAVKSRSACHQVEVAHRPVPHTASKGESSARPPESPVTSSTKRPARTNASVPAKRKKTTDQPPTLQVDGSVFKVPEPPRPLDRAAFVARETPSSTFQIPDPPVQHPVPSHSDPSTFHSVPEPLQMSGASTLHGALSSAFQVPQLLLHLQRPVQGGSPTLTKHPCGSVDPRQTTGASRFKPLRPAKLVEPDPASRQRTVARVEPIVVSTALDFNFRAMPPPVLSNISFPPRASERKWVSKWAIILSALSPADRKTCTLVSRTFRYAVYLSAAHILSRNFAGRRLHAVFEQHPVNMTNFWPYLRFRIDEVSRRRHAFNQSFLGRLVNAIGYDPLSAHLWTCPDDEKQVDIALRFVLTRMWFAVSVGAYGHDASKWSKSTIRDIREVVPGEVWQVVARDEGTGEMGRFYVLEATCEVIGQSQLPGEGTLAYGLRADWTAWIAQPTRGLPCSLLERVAWSNTEDYHRGVSKAWLHRVQGQDAESVAKKRVAERYVLASVVANGISGPWMSTNAMAQEFAGLPVTNGAHAGRAVHTVNMYLAAHHHIESVHFTTSKGEVLHDAIAVVQTPGREHYVLRDNGMQVGCEEEGIPQVWQEIIGCDGLGRAPSLHP